MCFIVAVFVCPARETAFENVYFLRSWREPSIFSRARGAALLRKLAIKHNSRFVLQLFFEFIYVLSKLLRRDIDRTFNMSSDTVAVPYIDDGWRHIAG